MTTTETAEAFAIFDRKDSIVLLVNDDSQREIRCDSMDDAKWFAEDIAARPLDWTKDDAGTIWSK